MQLVVLSLPMYRNRYSLYAAPAYPLFLSPKSRSGSYPVVRQWITTLEISLTRVLARCLLSPFLSEAIK